VKREAKKAQTSTDQKCQQSIKARIPREGPAEEEGGCVEEKKTLGLKGLLSAFQTRFSNQGKVHLYS